MITIYLSQGGLMVSFPINPYSLAISSASNDEKTSIVGIGDIIIQRLHALHEIPLNGYFPRESGPEGHVAAIKAMRTNRKPCVFAVSGLGESYLVGIQDFKYERRGGEHYDIYFDMLLSEYKTYGARVVEDKQPAVPARLDNKESPGENYTVKKGDCLSHITKALTGSTKGWQELYALNKGVVGSNPNLIKPGQQLIIPESWGKS